MARTLRERWCDFLLAGLLAGGLSACHSVVIPPSRQHLSPPASPALPEKQTAPVSVKPETLASEPDAHPKPNPKPLPKPETYTLVVTNLPVQEILFALARDAGINIDIAPGVQGNITINSLNQTLPQILDRISRQVEIRYELNDNHLIILPDTPFLKSYKINYVNINRDADGGISNTTQVGTATNPTGLAVTTGNNSQLAIKNASKNHFWERLEQNIKDLLRETDKILPEGSSETVIEQNSTTSNSNVALAPAPPTQRRHTDKPAATQGNVLSGVVEGEGTTVTRRSTFREAASVIMNPESGLVTVRATSRQHEQIQAFIAQVLSHARRQVLIEATIAEVRLSKNYQQGINWSNLRLGASGLQVSQSGTGSLGAANSGSFIKLDYLKPVSSLGTLAASISLLETFGDVKVLSSPKLSVMNNQTAMLRVVDNLVYFSVKADTTTNQTTSTTIYTTTANTVPIGFTMSVTPQIDENDTVQLNLRPSITRLLGYVNDPNPSLSAAGVTSRIPQTQSREMESVLSIENDQIAVLGGLMQDEINNQSDGVPLLSNIPFLGALFKNRNDTTIKTELVIFLRPKVLKDASIGADFSGFRGELPGKDFLMPESKRPSAAAGGAP